MEATLEKNTVARYKAYKHSGEDWIGDVPEHWKVLKLKRLFHEKKKITNVDLPCGSISFGRVVFKDDEKIPISTKKSYQVLAKGEFLLNPLNLNYDLISLRIGLSEIDAVVSSGYIILQASVDFDKNYFKWLMHRFDVAFMKTLGSGVRQTINYSDIGDSLLTFPPLAEQTAIASFLDKKTALIDKAIAIKEKQIELLKERKQILIQKAVTRGLDENVKLKDSGVEWIGMIPEHWEVKRIKHLVEKSFSGGTPATDKLDHWDGGIPWISSVDVKTDMLVNTLREISIKGLKNSSSNLAPKGSVIFVTRSGILQHTFPISILGKEMAINQDIKCLILKDFLYPEYFQKMIAGNNSRILVEVRQQAATVESIDMEAFFNLQIPIPKKNEQAKIANYIQNISLKISRTVSIKEQEIEKLREYKSSLINDAVTGRIKVC